jgi:hypothetical protein
MSEKLTATVSRVFDESEPPNEAGLRVTLGKLVWRFDYSRQAPRSGDWPAEMQRVEIYRYDPEPAKHGASEPENLPFNEFERT